MFHPTGSISDKSRTANATPLASLETNPCLFEPIIFAWINQTVALFWQIQMAVFFGKERKWLCVHAHVHVRCVSPPGHGFCSCGRCICSDGWFGKHCQFPRSCDMTDEQSKSLCETADGIMCSGKGRRDDASSATLKNLLKIKVGSLICLLGNKLNN